MNYIIRMRDDLAEEGLSVPACKTFTDYDTMVDVEYISAEELQDARVGDDPADPDDHAFWYIQLKDGRSFYFLSVDLDFDDEDNPRPNKEYIVYWRREALHKTTVVAYNEQDAIDRVTNGFSTDSMFEEEIEEFGDMSIDSIELVERQAK